MSSTERLLAYRGLGASREGFAIEQLVRVLELREEECFNYAVQGGAEMDLVVRRPRGLIGFEFKAGAVPRAMASMHQSIEDLGLEHVWVVYPGERDFPLGDKIDAIGVRNLRELTRRI